MSLNVSFITYLPSLSFNRLFRFDLASSAGRVAARLLSRSRDRARFPVRFPVIDAGGSLGGFFCERAMHRVIEEKKRADSSYEQHLKGADRLLGGFIVAARGGHLCGSASNCKQEIAIPSSMRFSKMLSGRLRATNSVASSSSSS